jgi:hypothetical protein
MLPFNQVAMQMEYVRYPEPVLLDPAKPFRNGF